jgi:hypothetical protein
MATKKKPSKKAVKKKTTVLKTQSVKIMMAKAIDIELLDEIRVISDADGAGNILISHRSLSATNNSSILDLAKKVKSGWLWIQKCDEEKYYDKVLEG